MELSAREFKKQIMDERFGEYYTSGKVWVQRIRKIIRQKDSVIRFVSRKDHLQRIQINFRSFR